MPPIFHSREKNPRKMNQKEDNLQSFSIGRGFINFITNLGGPISHALAVWWRLLDFSVTNVARLIRVIPATIRFGCPMCNVFAFFHWVYNFIVESLAAQAIKPVTLGRPLHCGLREGVVNPDPNDLTTNIGTNERELSQDHDRTSKIFYSPITREEEKMKDEFNITILFQERVPKKMVSINESIEVIESIKKKTKKMKKKKSTEKLPSIGGEEEEPKPLKSILKVGSNVKENETS